MTTAENSSAIDFVPGLAEVKPQHVDLAFHQRRVDRRDSTIRTLRAQLAEAVDLAHRATMLAEKAQEREGVVTAERDAALADLATEQADLGEQGAQGRADAINAEAERDQMREQRDFALVNLDRVITERDAVRAEASTLRAVLGGARDLIHRLRTENAARRIREREAVASAGVLENELDDANALLNEVREAWTEEGRVPTWHQRQQKRLAREWPRLAVIVRKIAGGAR